jgi:hypothetical protein
MLRDVGTTVGVLGRGDWPSAVRAVGGCDYGLAPPPAAPERSSCVRCVVRCMCMLHGNRLTLQGDPEALEIERTRLKLKRFWHSIEV